MKKPLDKGGLGIRRVSTANQALLGKMSWDLAVDNDSLWSRIIKGKYCISMEGLTPKQRSQTSAVWKAVSWEWSLVSNNVCWRVGNGASINL